jgi:hypothetical protein
MKNRREIDSCRTLLATISDELMEKRKQTLNDGDEDLFALMITSEDAEREDQRMTVEEVRDQMATMVSSIHIAAHTNPPVLCRKHNHQRPSGGHSAQPGMLPRVPGPVARRDHDH